MDEKPKKVRSYFDLDSCIVIANFNRLKSKKPAIVSKLDLCVQLFEVKGVKERYLNYKSLYYKIKRREVDGFFTEDKVLSDILCKFLGVKNEDLIK